MIGFILLSIIGFVSSQDNTTSTNSSTVSVTSESNSTTSTYNYGTPTSYDLNSTSTDNSTSAYAAYDTNQDVNITDMSDSTVQQADAAPVTCPACNPSVITKNCGGEAARVPTLESQVKSKTMEVAKCREAKLKLGEAAREKLNQAREQAQQAIKRQSEQSRKLLDDCNKSKRKLSADAIKHEKDVVQPLRDAAAKHREELAKCKTELGHAKTEATRASSAEKQCQTKLAGCESRNSHNVEVAASTLSHSSFFESATFYTLLITNVVFASLAVWFGLKSQKTNQVYHPLLA